jgi:hypothetical protein
MQVGLIVSIRLLRLRLGRVKELLAPLVMAPPLREATDEIVPISAKASAGIWHLLLRFSSDAFAYETHFGFVPVFGNERSETERLPG